jgi:hypothetical protein
MILVVILFALTIAAQGDCVTNLPQLVFWNYKSTQVVMEGVMLYYSCGYRGI